MNNRGLVVAAIGVLVIVQVIGGNALQRLGVIGSTSGSNT